MSGRFLPLLDVFGDDVVTELFSEREYVRCWLEVERALAKAQAEFGVIPEGAAQAIEAELTADKIDLDRLREDTRVVGYPILPLLEQISASSSEAVGSYVHWGATTQDIMDTGLVLAVGRSLDLLEQRCIELVDALASLAVEHRASVLAARTHAQQAVPTTFGAKLAVWVDEFGRHVDRVRDVRPRVVRVQLFGAAGTAAALGPTSRDVRRRVAELLGVGVTDVPWHTARDGVAEVGFVAAGVAATCGKVAREVIELSRTEIGEVREVANMSRGASSTMPQKANPIASETIVGLVSLARHLVPALLEAMQAGHERSAGEWQIEWDAVPTLLALSHSAVVTTTSLIEGLEVVPARMATNMQADGGMLMSEAVMIALAPHIGRHAAHHLVYDACRVARENGRDLTAVLEEALPGDLASQLPPIALLLEPEAYLGEADAIVDAALASRRHAGDV
jgi:3-carboxy-cis,cis-muconate cycloisomerase